MRESEQIKEYVESRHGEPNKFLLLPKIGLLGSHTGNEKRVNYEFKATFAFFLCFHSFFHFF